MTETRLAQNTVILQILWYRRKALFKTAIIGLALSVLVTLLLPKRFECVSRLIAQPELPEAFLVGMLDSRTVKDDLINKFGLKRVYRNSYWEDARKTLTRNTDISQDPTSGILTIRVKDTSPLRAAGMAQEYADALNRIIIRLNASSAHENRVSIGQRLARVNRDLESAEKALSAFSSGNTLVDIDVEKSSIIQEVSDLQQQLVDKRSQLRSLRTLYAEGSPQVRASQASVNEMRRGLGKVAGINTSDEDSLYPTQTSSRTTMRKLPLLAVADADLNRTVNSNAALAEGLGALYELAKVDEVEEIPFVSAIDLPVVPVTAIWPPHFLFILIGTLGSVLLAALWILGAWHWEEIDAQNPWKMLGLEICTTIEGYLRSKVGLGAQPKGPTEYHEVSGTVP